MVHEALLISSSPAWFAAWYSNRTSEFKQLQHADSSICSDYRETAAIIGMQQIDPDGPDHAFCMHQ